MAGTQVGNQASTSNSEIGSSSNTTVLQMIPEDDISGGLSQSARGCDLIQIIVSLWFRMTEYKLGTRKEIVPV